MAEERGRVGDNYQSTSSGKAVVDLNRLFVPDFNIQNPQTYLTTTCSRTNSQAVVKECADYRDALAEIAAKKSIAIKTLFMSALTSSIFLFLVWLVLRWIGRGFGQKKN